MTNEFEVITGAAKGIGAAAGKCFAKKGTISGSSTCLLR
jgi:hypothetical protein